ncbi:MAG: fumarylacetoacetate hydrolase family protein [Hyphomicrobiaceae bacterium]|nr:fumarylacetoacetate hydrolase family protein [Hyphomicrobiaceae bacterium]
MAMFDPKAAAAYVAEAHRTRAPYRNLPQEVSPPSVADAYAAQEALCELWTPLHGPVRGLKIATTTKVMQQLMGIDHPCGGMLYERRIHQSPARLRLGDFMNLMIECELALRLGADLPRTSRAYTAADVRPAVAEAMPAFELIDDRRAHYKSTSALSLIADNAWNGGIVLGAPQRVPEGLDLDGIKGRLTVNGAERGGGATDDPMGALAWLANLAAGRGRPIEAGMVVITGSVMPTVPIAAGDTFVFTLDGLGSTEMSGIQ